jgi:hypothetical protein
MAYMVEKRNEYNVFMVKPERKRKTGRPKSKGKDNIKNVLEEV